MIRRVVIDPRKNLSEIGVAVGIFCADANVRLIEHDFFVLIRLPGALQNIGQSFFLAFLRVEIS